MPSITQVPAWSYRQFDADLARDVPAEAYGGWHQTTIEIAPAHTALVVMHAWDVGSADDYPGHFRCVEYLPRARRIVREVFPPLLAAVRSSPIRVYHVTGCGAYGRKYPGYARAAQLAGTAAGNRDSIEPDAAYKMLRAMRKSQVFPGEHNAADISRSMSQVDFPAEARPAGNEAVCEDDRQLFAVCRDDGVNHLIYVGFAINWCLLMSPGGMLDMSRRGLLCSTVREAVTAVENRESARLELNKQEALWRVAMQFGFVFDCRPFIAAVAPVGNPSP